MSLRRYTPRPATQYTGDALPTPRTAVKRRETPQSAALLDTSQAARLVVPLPKPVFLRSPKYRKWVASLDCAHCGIAGLSNACHADEGKGMSLKSCDSTCWPGCVSRPGGRVGCHEAIGGTGLFTRIERRKLERDYGKETRAAAKAAGMWPKGWP